MTIQEYKKILEEKKKNAILDYEIKQKESRCLQDARIETKIASQMAMSKLLGSIDAYTDAIVLLDKVVDPTNPAESYEDHPDWRKDNNE